MRFGLIAFMLLAATAAAAQQSPAVPANRTGTCTVEGSVVAADTGQPLRRAAVLLERIGRESQSQYVLTDGSGHFELKNIDPGHYVLMASHAGYVRMDYGQRSLDAPGSELALASGQVIQDATFKLPRAAAISGHVYDENGDPVEHAGVQAMKYRYVRGKRILEPAPGGYVETDDQGEYRIYDLTPGEYYVSASSSAMTKFAKFGGEAVNPSDGSYPETFYPSTTDASAASPLQLASGDDFPGVDITLTPAKTYHVRGQVFDGIDNKPAEVGVSVSLRSRGEAGKSSAGYYTLPRDSQGDFEFGGVQPGSYYLDAGLSAHGKELLAQVPIEVVDSDINGLTVTIGAGADIHGQVKVTGGSINFAGIQVGLAARDPQLTFSLGANIDSNGNLTFRGVSDGGYVVQVWGLPPDDYLRQVLLNGQDVSESGIDVSGGQSPGALEIVIDANGGRLQGVVTKDSKPLTDAKVVLLPTDSAAAKDDALIKETSTDQYGAFVIRGIRPGDYRVFAFQQVEEGAWADPNFMSRIQDKGQEVEISEGTERTVQLQAIAPNGTGEIQ